MMFTCFPFKRNHSSTHNYNLLKTEGHIPQILNIMAVPVVHLTITFISIKFNTLGLLTGNMSVPVLLAIGQN